MTEHEPKEIEASNDLVDSSADTGNGRANVLSVVGIGASAGGLEALQSLFDALPDSTGAAYVVVQHLSRDFRSVMDELLGRRTNMPVQIAGDGMPLERNHVYLIPPGHDLSVEEDVLHLTPQRDEGLHLPIDHFLRSLAQNSKADAYAVILSGSGSDGARGIRDIKELGGVVLAQDAETAKFDGMPNSALRTGLVDASLSPEGIARQLAVLLGSPPTVPTTEEHDRVEPEEPSSPYDRLLNYLYRNKGVDFSEFKQGTIGRRIERRALINNKRNLEDYIEFLTEQPGELDALFQELLIGVTSFFRDPEGFEALRDELEKRFETWDYETGPFRAWVSASSSGEEAYTIAMILDQISSSLERPVEFKVFATDVSPQAISIAGQGCYPLSIEADLSPQLLQRYFTREEDNYRVVSRIRERVIFAVHDIAVDAPFTRMDLVTCRNMLIYFRRELQERVTSLLHFALRGSGILMLGPSESLIALKSDFEVLHHRWKIFRKRRDGRTMPLLHGLQSSDVRNRDKGSIGWAETRERAQHLVQDLFQGLFSNYVEAGFVFDDQQKLIYSFGEIERYTRLPQGLVRLDSLSIIVEGLKSPMMLAIRQAQSSRGDVSLRNVELKGPNGPTRVDIRVFRIESKGFPTSLYVAVIEDSRPAAETSNTSVIEQDVTAQSRVDELEHELASTKESLQAAIEELETSNEEMQSTNEELVASNEELQSTNEELQSVNEELHTINTEYQNKIAELTEISADLEEFLNVSEIGTVFLDADLCIRKYTPGVRNAIPIREHDLGRPLTDLGHNLVDIDLEQLVEGTLRKRTALDREVRTARGQRFYLRVRPYDPRSGRSRGVLLAFVDMTSEEVIREDMQRLEALIEFTSEKEPDIVYWTYDLTRAGFEFASEGFHHIWDQSVQKLLESEQTWFDAIPPGDRQRCRDAFSHVRNLREFSILHRVRHEDGSVRWVRSSGQYHDGGRERRPAILGFSHDMTGLVDVRGKVLAARSMPGTSTQQLLRVLAETTGQALLVADGENEIIFVNGPASERFSKKPQELMGNDLRALISNQDSFDSVTAGRSRAEKLRLQIIGEDEPIDATIAHLPDLTLAGTALLLVF